MAVEVDLTLSGTHQRQIQDHSTGPSRSLFGTKAETLERFKGLVRRSIVLEMDYFTVAEWRKSSTSILMSIQARFSPAPLVVRSSAANEDGHLRSMAGAYTSYLDIDSADLGALRAAIEGVVCSYSGNPYDQILIQPMLGAVAISGVIMTHDLNSGAPYYILNYDDESGKTDSITGGQGVNKTVVVHRNFLPEHIESQRIGRLLEMIRELENICGDREPLDIEFAQTEDGQLFLLQVRRITVQQNWNRNVRTRIDDALRHIERFFADRSRQRPGIAGASTILGQMPDWNPAEIIGTTPRPLAVSLYRRLVTDDVWREARAAMGYRPLGRETLMVLMAGRPYIDVRNSFNSFLPSGLEPEVEHALVDAWLERLARHPELHDKVEFQVAQTLLDFTFDQDFQERYEDILLPDQLQNYKSSLHRLTKLNVTLAPTGSLNEALRKIWQLERVQTHQDLSHAGFPLSLMWTLLDQCRELGTLPFACIARHAFMAESLLRSAVARGALSAERVAEFKRTLITITGDLTRDFGQVLSSRLSTGVFLHTYGHLRPGTYDILSLRYDQRADLFRDCHMPDSLERPDRFVLLDVERHALAALLLESGLDHLQPESLLHYAELAIVNREHSKFVFTRHLSNVLECVASWGECLGLSRDDLSYLTLADIEETAQQSVLCDLEIHLKDLVEVRRQEAASVQSLKLGYVIRDRHDLYVVPLHRGAPNFVTSHNIEGQTVLLDSRMMGHLDLYKKIVCIENADPGFDWIFTRNIAGLVSKFGGANSHMTIRCAELNLPAAIGVGEQTFDRLLLAGRVELDCAAKIIRPIYG